MDELTREFLIESQEGLDRMERCLTELENHPEDAALISEIFRAVHTIKGTTGFLGFTHLEKLSHAGENLLGLLRDGKLAASAPVITGLLQLLDVLRSILKTIESTEREGDDADQAPLIALLERLKVPAESESDGEAAAAKAPRVRKSMKKAGAVSTALPVRPSLAPAPGQIVGVEEHAGPSTPISTPSVPADQGAGVSAPVHSQASESTLRVDVALLNRMMNLVGELVLTRNQVLQATSADPNMTMLSRRLDMVTADLREAVMKARLQPVSNIFSKMPRLVRDLSQQLGRRVRLEMEGQDTELDKSLLEAIKDPLTHAVRNALDHGIEPPEVRASAGKDPEGSLKLRALQEGSHVVVEVSDDGAGIPADKVRATAIERGLISADRTAQLPERELLQLVFLPGFSTAATVTNISGRGVGMDVVRTNVERIGGKVEIDSVAGRGTTLRLRIPLTLAIIPALIVRSAGQSFALPQGALSELVHISPERAAEIEWIESAPLYRLRGGLLPLVFLDRLLEVSAQAAVDAARDRFIAVLDADGRRFGLVVDGLADPEEIVVKPLSATLKGIGLYSGATVLGSGDLALILDPGAIACKAGITISAEEASRDSASDSHEDLAATDYLLVEAAGGRAAIPLAHVLRIEQLPMARIESIEHRPVLNLEGQLLPIQDPGDLLSVRQNHPDANAIIVVCRDGGRHVGIAVSHVLDVAVGSDLLDAGTQQQTGGVTLLKDCVTDIVQLNNVPSLQTRALEQSPHPLEEAIQ
ncbi:MAG TPA: chemotaxis protein CheW [Terracidiphilus sp.]|nr:chemotaxis protein CheW [Terracidiphilus sp.]